MKNQITQARHWVSKSLFISVLMLFGVASFAQPGGHGPRGNTGGHGGAPPLPCNAHFLSHPDSIVNGMVFINHPGSGAATFAWDFGDGSTSTQSNPSYVYANPGTYYVCLTVTDTVHGGCSNTWCDSVRVFTPMPHCNAHFFHRRDSVPNGVRFLTAHNSPGASYAWDLGDGSTSTDPTPAHTYANAGVYYVCLTVTNSNAGGTCSDTFCDSVHVFTPAPRCNAHFRARRDSDTTIVNGLMFNSVRNSPGAIFAWDFGDGTTSTLANPAHAYANAGVYYVCLTVTNTNAGGTCSDTFCDSVNTVHPGHRGHHHPPHHLRLAESNTSKISNPETDAVVSLYPNPLITSSTIHIENTTGNVTFRMYQLNGEVVMTKQLGNGDFEITKDNLSEGLYFYSVEDGNINIAKGKLRVY